MTAALADRLSKVKPSPSMAAKTQVDALRAAGNRIFDFSIGEPDFPTPQHIAAAGVEAILAGKTRYTASNGTPALRGAIAQKLQRENGLAYEPSEIVVGSGAKIVIFHALAATLNEGDEVVVPAPYWVSYPDMVALHGGVPVIVPCTAASGYKLVAPALEGVITPKTRWLILNSPNNPTGAVYSKAELLALADVLRRHPQVSILTDEIYEHFTYGDAVHYSLPALAPDLKERTLIVNGMSKAYAMTGWRLGYGAGPKALVNAITLLLSQSTSCASAFVQEAAAAALQGPQDCVREAAALFSGRRDHMLAMLADIRGIDCSPPGGAFYLFPSVAALVGATTPEGTVLGNDTDVVLYLLKAAHVAAIDGSSYGAPNHLRLSFATSMEQLTAGCAAMKAALEACTFSTSTTLETHHA